MPRLKFLETAVALITHGLEFRQLVDIDGDPPGLVAGEQMSRALEMDRRAICFR